MNSLITRIHKNKIAQLESPMVKPDEVAKIGREYERVQKDMDARLAEWERMQN
ncbi:MAG: hypothetical protein JETCAE01_19770 [Anaerolineaceae bacterium]|nr:MAG: hypothetical protein JETCAE01_19770 [Anaerolineaceae bacterium]